MPDEWISAPHTVACLEGKSFQLIEQETLICLIVSLNLMVDVGDSERTPFYEGVHSRCLKKKKDY